MFWLIGGTELVWGLVSLAPRRFADAFAPQLQHAPWVGFHFYDLGFPSFLALVGISIALSMARYTEKGNRPAAVYGRILRRLVLLFVLGLVYNGFFHHPWHELRVAGVLQRIGICYAAAALVVLHFKPRGQAVIAAALLLGYWALMALVPVPGVGAGILTPAGNLAGYVDRHLLPQPMCCYTFGDSCGILSTIPAIATVLIGALAGAWLRAAGTAAYRISGLVLAGVISLAAGEAWGHWFPVIKHLWTSSYVLVSAGIGLLILAFFYWLIDGRGYRRWAFFFVVIGANAILLYVLSSQLSIMMLVRYLGYGDGQRLGMFWQTGLHAFDLAWAWLLVWFLYRKKIFLRV